MEAMHILQVIKDGLKSAMIIPCVGWEHVFTLPDDAMVIMSSNLHYLYAPSFLRFVEQIVVVSKGAGHHHAQGYGVYVRPQDHDAGV